MPRKSISDMIPDIEAPAVEPAATPPPSNGTVPAPGPAVQAPAPAPPVPEMDDRRQNRWRQALNAQALKVVAAHKRAEEAEQEWWTLLADAGDAGVPGHLVIAAAAAADLETLGLGDASA